MSPRLDLSPDLLGRVNRGLDEIRAGRMVILVDDEDRENEGDLTMAADKVTPEAINFMATHGRGLICLALDESISDRLELPMMRAPGRSGPPLGTAFTVSVEARQGVTTGISAADRAHTIRTVINPSARPDDLVTPGHIFPLKARTGGVLVRTGQTEGSVDLARLSGASPAGVICEIMNDDGTMARAADLERFAQRHKIMIVTIADLIQYRMQTERLVRRIREQNVVLDATGTSFKAIAYEVPTEKRQFLALVQGDVTTPEPVLTRVHQGSLFADLFSSTESDGGHNLREALKAINLAGRGVCLYLPSTRDIFTEMKGPGPGASGPASAGADGLAALASAIDATSEGAPHLAPLREFGLGAQVLADLGVKRIRLLSNNARKIANLAGFGLEVVERVPLVAMHDVR